MVAAFNVATLLAAKPTGVDAQSVSAKRRIQSSHEGGASNTRISGCELFYLSLFN
jgi:hypothetical protein